MVATDKNKRVLILVVRLHAECHLKIRLRERVLYTQTSSAAPFFSASAGEADRQRSDGTDLFSVGAFT